MTETVTPDTEFTLSFKRQRAVVSPWEAALRRYFVLDPHGAVRWAAGRGYLEFNDRLTPTGKIIPAAGTEWEPDDRFTGRYAIRLRTD